MRIDRFPEIKKMDGMVNAAAMGELQLVDRMLVCANENKLNDFKALFDPDGKMKNIYLSKEMPSNPPGPAAKLMKKLRDGEYKIELVNNGKAILKSSLMEYESLPPKYDKAAVTMKTTEYETCPPKYDYKIDNIEFFVG